MTSVPKDNQRPAGERALSPEEAFELVTAAVRPASRTVAVDLDEAAGRILAGSAVSSRPLPPFDQSAVDGYGIPKEIDGMAAPHRFRLVSGAAAGDHVAPRLQSGQVTRLATGAVVPNGVVAIVMRERVRLDGVDVVIDHPTAVGANIRRRGEDVSVGSTVAEAGMLIDARHVAIMAAAGISRTVVFERLRVSIVSTGNELVQLGEPLADHAIYDANRPMLKALLGVPWVKVLDGGIVRDETEALASRLVHLASESDAVLLSGGAAGSDTDHTAAGIICAGGVAQSIQIAQRPGKPLILGSIGETSILGLPGNTTAAMVNYMLYVGPMLLRLAGGRAARPVGETGLASSTFEHTVGRADFVPVRIVGRGPDGRPLLEQLSRGGSARLLPFVHADGLARLPADATVIESGESIIFYPFRTSLSI